jgi:hypothetical protein
MTMAFVLVVVAGCGGRQGEVSGTVTYGGKSLPSGTVTFLGKDKQVVGSSSITDGTYKIRQVPPGPVTITVSTPPSLGRGARGAALARKDMPAPLESIPIPPKYGNAEQSGLTYEVKPGAQDHPIDLK